MLGKPGPAEFRCWNGLDEDEYESLRISGRPLEGCKCRGCLFLAVRGWKPIARAELLAPKPEAA